MFNTVYAYSNAAGGVWISRAHMPQALSFHRAVVMPSDASVALVCGGVGERGYAEHTCSTYNVTVDKWTVEHATMHDARRAHGMAVYKGVVQLLHTALVH